MKYFRGFPIREYLGNIRLDQTADCKIAVSNVESIWFCADYGMSWCVIFLL